IHSENIFAEELVQSIHHQNTFIAVTAERSLLRALEGGCQVPIGAFAEVKSNGLYLDALVGSLDGSITFRKKVRGTKDEPEKIGKSLAKDLLNAGAKEILDEVYNNSRK
ncbi:MAG: hydroxymethylbilane synthase, partial [Ignavibacterium sp.]